LAVGCSKPSPTYDLVVANGRVMDPESGLDAVRNIGIRAGHIEAIATGALNGTRVVDAKGLVVAPGFVDLHEHGQQEESYALMVRDGVTSALEIEVGTGDVPAWYAARDGGQIVNYGVSIGHIKARMKVLRSRNALPAGLAELDRRRTYRSARLRLRKGLADGASLSALGAPTHRRDDGRSSGCFALRLRVTRRRTSI
jgi:predicted amidohydrolase YtcJ